MVHDMRSSDTTGEIKMHQWARGLTYSEAQFETIYDWQILGPLEASATSKGCSLKKGVQNQMNKIFDNNRK